MLVERGLRGSRAFCDAPPIALDKVVANLNIEMIGRPEPGNERKCWFTGAGYSDFAEICAGALGAEQIGVVEFRMGNQLFWVLMYGVMMYGVRVKGQSKTISSATAWRVYSVPLL